MSDDGMNRRVVVTQYDTDVITFRSDDGVHTLCGADDEISCWEGFPS